LAFARLYQQATPRGQPQQRTGSHSPQNVKPVHTTVKRHPRFIDAGFRGHHLDCSGRHVGYVSDQDVNAATQISRKRFEKVAFEHATATVDEVATGTPNRCGRDVGGVQLDLWNGREHCGAYRA
jgi:hypothetical protein